MGVRPEVRFHGDAGEFLMRAGFGDFETLWALPGEPVDQPNRRGAGFSVVSRHDLVGRDGQARVFYLKRQQDYFARGRLGRRRLLLCREYRRLRLFARRGVCCPQVAALAVSPGREPVRGVLVTSALAEHVALDRLLDEFGNSLSDAIVEEVARFLRRMHRRRLFHGNLYPKHIHVRIGPAAGRAVVDPVAVIDLEDALWVPWRRYAAVRDLEKLNRYAPALSEFRRLRFVLRYLGERRFSPSGRRLVAAIVARSAKRGAGRR